MIKKNLRQSSLWLFILKLGKKFLVNIRDFSQTYPNFLQSIQLTFIYLFAFIDLVYSLIPTVFAFGYFPEGLKPIFPILKAILDFPHLRFWASPEKVYLLSFAVLEFMVIRPIFKFSKLVRYNILLLFSLLMLQGLAISYWDLLVHRQLATPVAKLAFDQAAPLFIDRSLASFVFYFIFLFYFVTYLSLYLQAIAGKFSTLPGVSWLTDSVSFWLRIRTPTMGFGKRKRKKN
jgi:hypothetical protein